MPHFATIPATTQRQIVEIIANRLLRYASGAPLDSPETWHHVALEMGVSVHFFNVPRGGRGEWRASPPEGDPSVITINRAYSPREQAQTWIHELAELLMHKMQPPLLDDGSDAGRYEGDPKDIKHRLARRIEKRLLG